MNIGTEVDNDVFRILQGVKLNVLTLLVLLTFIYVYIGCVFLVQA